MAIEAYIPTQVQLDGETVQHAELITLYDPDGPSANGSITGPATLPDGGSGKLVWQGRRDGKLWSVVCPQVTVVNASALGCEFTLAEPPQRTVLETTRTTDQPHKKGLEERFDIR